MFEWLLDLVFPRRSLGGEPGAWLTPGEEAALRRHPVCWEGLPLRRAGILSLDRLVAAGRAVTPELRRSVRLYKYARVRSLAVPLGGLLVPASALLQPGPDAALCPVPLHWVRLFDRGFNQAHLLADIVSGARGWPVRPLLSRVRATGSQAHRGGAERRRALDDAFRIRDVRVPPHVILIDDIATTGTTLDRCARVLKAAGVRRVEALVLALGGGRASAF